MPVEAHTTKNGRQSSRTGNNNTNETTTPKRRMSFSGGNIKDKISNALNYIDAKVIFLVHFLLTFLALSIWDFMPRSFLLYNLVFFAALLWAEPMSRVGKPAQADRILLVAVLNILCIVLDIVCYCPIGYRSYWVKRGVFKLSFSLLIINTSFRVLSTVALLRLYYYCVRQVNTFCNTLSTTVHSNGKLNSAIQKCLFVNTALSSPTSQASGPVHSSNNNNHITTTTSGDIAMIQANPIVMRHPQTQLSSAELNETAQHQHSSWSQHYVTPATPYNERRID